MEERNKKAKAGGFGQGWQKVEDCSSGGGGGTGDELGMTNIEDLFSE